MSKAKPIILNFILETKEVTKYIEQMNNMMQTVFQEELCNVYRMGEGETVQDVSGKDQLRVLKNHDFGMR